MYIYIQYIANFAYIWTLAKVSLVEFNFCWTLCKRVYTFCSELFWWFIFGSFWKCLEKSFHGLGNWKFSCREILLLIISQTLRP